MKTGIRQFYAAVGGFVTGNALEAGSTARGVALGVGLALFALAFVKD